MSETTEKYHELAEDSLETLQDAAKNMPLGVKIKYLGNSKQKGLVKVAKISDIYAMLLDRNVLVTVNETYLDAFDEEARDILLRQELDRVHVDMKSGKVKINAPELTTSVGVLKKFGIDAVARANQLHSLYESQQQDVKTEEGGLDDLRTADKAVEWLS